MQGEPETEVLLTVFREDRGEKEYNIIREIIEIPSVDGKIMSDFPDIGYINVSMFNENTGKELSDTINELNKKGMKKIVLDLRNNPGGALVAAVETADIFLDSGPIVHIKSKYNIKTYEAKNGGINLPMVVLVNEGSASASEILAGAIQDKKAGTLIGQTTFGKGVVQSLFKLDGGAAVKLTTAKYLTPNERDIHKKGIAPDIVVKMTNEETAYALLNAPDLDNDKQLKKAVEVLNK
jgi:carboxyl-terminal processing protease